MPVDPVSHHLQDTLLFGNQAWKFESDFSLTVSKALTDRAKLENVLCKVIVKFIDLSQFGQFTVLNRASFVTNVLIVLIGEIINFCYKEVAEIVLVSCLATLDHKLDFATKLLL